MYAELALDNNILEDVLSKKILKPCQRKNMVAYVVEHHQISISTAYRVASLPKSMYYYQKLKDDSATIAKLQELVLAYPTEGRIYILEEYVHRAINGIIK